MGRHYGRKIKNHLYIRFASLTASILLAAGMLMQPSAAITADAQAVPAAKTSSQEAPFELTMLDVGQGLSLLIKADNRYMIYDGGGRESSSYVVSYLKQHGVTNLQYMMASHYDEDHIAGLVGVLNTAKVQTIFCPDYEADSKIYESFVSAEKKSKAKVIHPDCGYTLSLGNAAVKVVSADNKAETENNRSIAMRISYGKFSVLVTGDAEEEEETKMLYGKYCLDADVYIAGHHGSQYSSTTPFLDAVSPAYTMISCGTGNSYGHPAAEALERIGKSGSKLFRTDVQHEVTVYSDGQTYWFSKEPTDNWTPGEKSAVSENTQAKPAVVPAEPTVKTAGGMEYILNTRSRKFHYPDCKAVKKMSPKNTEKSSEDRETLIKEGYKPCGICNP